MDEYMAKISFFAFSYTPMYYAQCSGQSMSISQNAALYSLLGVAFGGDAVNNFNLPDLRGKVVVGQGNSFVFGRYGGSASISIAQSNLPPHNHSAQLNLTNATTTVKANTTPGTGVGPSSRANCIGAVSAGALYNGTAPDVALNVGGNTVGGTVDIGITGNGLPISYMPPYCVLNACIVTNGIYPSRQ